MKRSRSLRTRLPSAWFSVLVLAANAPAQESRGQREPFTSDPRARALYDRMLDAMRSARSLSWVTDYRWNSQGLELGHATCRTWLAKPNFARVEATSIDGKRGGVLVGDGTWFWIYWPAGRPRYGWEDSGKRAEEYERDRLVSYMKKRSPAGMHSLAHEVCELGAGMSMTILDASTFHGYTDSMQEHIDGVRRLPAETVQGEECDGIEVSLMQNQRSWHLWLSRRDHLPRKLHQVIRVSHEIHMDELWSDVVVDADIPRERFAWSPPQGWVQWSMPPIEEGLLRPGSEAPDFALAGLDGKKVRLSDFRGRPVWMFKWRVG